MELLLTSISSIDNFCSIELKLLDYLNYREFLTSSHLQKQKTINFSTQYKITFLHHFLEQW